MSDEYNDDTVDALAAQVAAKKKELEEVAAALEPLANEERRLMEEKREFELYMQKKQAEFRARQDEIANKAWDERQRKRKLLQEADSLERQLQQAQKAAEAKREWATLESRWDKMTMGAPWREWAKDHQLSGAKKITYEGRMILGDTMGLGKTLTSLIAIDMIEAATKDASPDNPVEFGSMK